MNQEGSTQGIFGQATGRNLYCSGCKKPLPSPGLNQRVLICGYCGTQSALTPPIKMVQPTDFGSVSGPVDIRLESGVSEFDDEFEIKLKPETTRTTPVPESPAWHLASSTLPSSSNAIDEYQVASEPVTNRRDSWNSSAEFDAETRIQRAQGAYNESAGLYPLERHYPTLEAMQRLYKLFAYIAILIVFPYVAFRFLYLLVTTKERYLEALAVFLEFAVPALFGCIGIAATLLAASEGIRLAMDIQDNTLRVANRSGRRKMN